MNASSKQLLESVLILLQQGRPTQTLSPKNEVIKSPTQFSTDVKALSHLLGSLKTCEGDGGGDCGGGLVSTGGGLLSTGGGGGLLSTGGGGGLLLTGGGGGLLSTSGEGGGL